MSEDLLSPTQIRKARLALGLSQKELADHLGVAEESISRWESGGLRQSRAMDTLLRVYFTLPAARALLSGRGASEGSSPRSAARSQDPTPCPEVTGTKEGAAGRKKVAVLLGSLEEPRRIRDLAKLHLWSGRSLYRYDLVRGTLIHIPRPPHDLVDDYLTRGHPIPHPPGVPASDVAWWVGYGRAQAGRLGLDLCQSPESGQDSDTR